MNEPGRVPLAVTTSGKPQEGIILRAREAARAWGLPFIPRRKKEPLGPLLATAAEALLVFEREGDVSLWDAENSFSFNPGMAHLRRMRWLAGERGDALVRVAELREGDHVLDCTLGLGQDALVAAVVVGPRGRVVGLEKSLALYAVVSEGLKADLGAGSCRVEPVHADAHTYLRALPSGAFDVVYFDPMFEKPKKSQPAFEMLRRFAEHAPLTPEVLEEARRVARRWVVVKGAKHSEDLKKLGLEAEPGSRYTSVIWGRTPARSPSRE